MSKKSKRKQEGVHVDESHAQQKELRKAEETPKTEAAEFDRSAEEFSDLFDPPRKGHR
jgi:hypothetical protein